MGPSPNSLHNVARDDSALTSSFLAPNTHASHLRLEDVGLMSGRRSTCGACLRGPGKGLETRDAQLLVGEGPLTNACHDLSTSAFFGAGNNRQLVHIDQHHDIRLLLSTAPPSRRCRLLIAHPTCLDQPGALPATQRIESL